VNKSRDHNKKKVKKILEMLTQNSSEFTEDVLLDLIEDYNQPSIENIWQDDNSSVSFWIVLINGINNPKEVNLVKDVLFWKEFFGRNLAKVSCLQSSDNRQFSFCLKQFNVQNCPAIIFSDDELFTEFIHLDSDFLTKLTDETDGVLTMCNRVHQQIINGNSLGSISKSIHSDAFWDLVEKIDIIRKLISQNKIESAISKLMKNQNIPLKSLVHKELITVSSEFYSLEEKIRIGNTSSDEINLNRNKIVVRLLKIIDEIE